MVVSGLMDVGFSMIYVGFNVVDMMVVQRS